MTLILSKETAQEIVNEDTDDYELVRTVLEDTSRWSLHYSAIFAVAGQKETGPWWEVDYRRGATESQDEQPFEYENEVHAREVFPVAVQTIQWQNKPVTIEGKAN